MIPSDHNRIIEIVCAAMNCTPEELRSDSKVQHIAHARMMVCYILRKYLHFTFSKIGDVVQRNHSSVIQAVNRVSEFIESEQWIKGIFNGIMEVVQSDRGSVSAALVWCTCTKCKKDKLIDHFKMGTYTKTMKSGKTKVYKIRHKVCQGCRTEQAKKWMIERSRNEKLWKAA